MSFLLKRKNIPLYVWDVKFEASERKVIKVIYKVPSRKFYEDVNIFFYNLSSGSGWYKSIEKATVRAQIMDFDLNLIKYPRPSNFHIDKTSNEYVWEFVDLEPTQEDDVSLQYVVPK